jgi:hypothetical protein
MDAEIIDKAFALIKKHSVKIDEVLVNVALEACIALRDLNRLRNRADAERCSDCSVFGTPERLLGCCTTYLVPGTK